jgi:ferrous iron transport protein B
MLPIQDFVVMLTLTLTVPCIASTMVILKERGWREGILIWCIIYALAFLIGGVTVRLLESFSKSGVLHAPLLFGLIIFVMGAVLVMARLFRPRRAE